MAKRWFNTTYGKEWLKTAILCVFLGVAIAVATPNFVLADTIFNDNFESYEIGNIDGQGLWQNANNNCAVQSDVFFEGSKALKCQRTGGNPEVKKFETPIETGQLLFYFNFKTPIETANWSYFNLRLWTEGHYYAFDGGFGIHPNGDNSAMVLEYYDGTFKVLADDISLDAWHYIKWDWDAGTDEFRINLDNNYTTGWYPSYEGAFLSIDGFQEATYGTTIYLDNFFGGFTCGYGLNKSCSVCETYDTCTAGGCSWFYSVYLQDYFCVAPSIPPPEECGSFYKCQYCLGQSACENELNCEWIDRGQGNKCYMREPTIPPVQAGWEVPTLENCDELSGVEKWLCQIKNFMAGIFMPTQEKIDNLYQTFANFKEKFPFNYINALKDFFSDVRISLDNPKAIPITILGKESNVSFAFWDKTTTIGGTLETFKNILIDFTTIIILMVWFVWLISFVRRIF